MELANIGKALAALIVAMLVITLGVVVAMVVFATPGHALTDTTYAATAQTHRHR